MDEAFSREEGVRTYPPRSVFCRIGRPRVAQSCSRFSGGLGAGLFGQRTLRARVTQRRTTQQGLERGVSVSPATSDHRLRSADGLHRSFLRNKFAPTTIHLESPFAVSP